MTQLQSVVFVWKCVSIFRRTPQSHIYQIELVFVQLADERKIQTVDKSDPPTVYLVSNFITFRAILNRFEVNGVCLVKSKVLLNWKNVDAQRAYQCVVVNYRACHIPHISEFSRSVVSHNIRLNEKC